MDDEASQARSFHVRRTMLGFSAAAVCAPQAVWAQGYPAKPITLVVPFPPGAVTDRLARSVGEQLQRRLGQPVVVENLGGASGSLAALKVVRSPADGYTLMLGTVNDVVLAPLVLKKAGYAPKDFSFITKIGGAPTILVANNGFPASTTDELVAYARKSAAPLPIGATGIATLQTFGGQLFAEAAGIKFSVVPYKGGGPLLTDLLGGQVQLATISMPSALQLVRTGKLKSLGIITTQRDPTAPELSTVNESKSVKGVEADLWAGLVGPPDMPAPVVARLSAAMKEILADPAFRAAETKAGTALSDFQEPQAFRQFVQREEARMKPLAARIDIE